MEDASLTLTLFHDGQFYVGIFERREGLQLSVCRVVFGAEPKDGEIMDFLNRDFRRLSFSPKVKEERKAAALQPEAAAKRDSPSGELHRYRHKVSAGASAPAGAE